ncbi:hypothetical protein [Mucilaginibacter arboris]|uniref:Uncharacterized protein n=1 Tax=Mucilaginibacter arboris TaxID=2682090 RepID=A0A7K1SYI8_9SPHI|nr:hypothetical protein [Mucilaginibacter arboris]MVN22379.1 hypothetical protein [Mucilaginibacter arboris]
MKKNVTLIKDYSKLTDSNLDLKGGKIIASLTNNTDFPATVPTLHDFTTVKNSYSQNLVAASSGDRAAIAMKNQEKDSLLGAMRMLAINLEGLSLGNQAKLAGTGFDLAATGSSVPAMAAPTGYTLADGLNTGELKSTVKGVAQAIMYSHEYSLAQPDENTTWTTWVTTTVSYTFTGLPSGTRVYARVGAIGRKDQLAYSDVLSRIVQ